MSIAAVPSYLQRENHEFYLSAPPGHRFLLYFAAWGENQETGKIDWRMKDRVPKIDKKTKKKEVSHSTSGPMWEDVPNDQFACTIAACKTPTYDEERPRVRKPKADAGLKPWIPMINGLLKRQAALAATVPSGSRFCLEAVTTAPFTTGLGNEHPLENGFAFLNPYGLPYLPGSGVKGVVRRAAQELASGMWEDDRGWRGLDQPAYTVTFGSGKSRVSLKLSVLDVLFGREPPAGDSNAIRGALAFWDVIPQIEGSSLMVEIMTPHQSHYYQEKKDKKSGDSISPHDSGQPNPISFLTVPPGSGFAFHVVCDGVHLARLTEGKGDGALDLLAEGPTHWKTLLTAAFEHAFEWLGFGAKTSVGYGAMATEAMRKTREEQQRARREAERLAEEHRKQEQAQANAEIWEGARIKFNRQNKSLSVEKGGKTAIAIAPKGEELLAKLPDEVRKKIETGQFVKVTARVAGNDLLEVIP